MSHYYCIPRGGHTTSKPRYTRGYVAGTGYATLRTPSGDKSDTVSISVETGCSFPGGHCIVLSSDEETTKTNGTPPVSPYAVIWMPIVSRTPRLSRQLTKR